MYRCPVCQQALNLHNNSYVCVNQHTFDRAKKGYVNLLLSQQKNSKQPGDNKMMISARQQFLSAGYYQPLAQQLAGQLSALKVKTLLDAGCGEGYYSDYLQQQQGIALTGVDISKEGILAACKRNKEIAWSIASVTDLPFLDQQFDAVLSVFCRVDESEFARVLNPGGYVCFVGPGDNHLPVLRSHLYEQVRDYQLEKQQQYFKQNFTLQSKQRLKFTIDVAGSEQIHNLLKMTPHYWHVKTEKKQALLQLAHLVDTVDMTISIYQLN